ncbi:hypothetical protein CLV60_103400 [Dyadobacter jiangsuensis]|uniref:Uncharacterized protein n=1 Tax=Dyadobacter jiangsuensis TaxID=1591085 RepID=A0A2P8GC31_9BACT|nr:hypothetical protein CLV60_103400 [Dyadobacter jiangsuensis]
MLLLLIVVKAAVMPAICLDYELRKEYITKNICVNRNRPQLHCDGKCYLAKKLAESQKQEEQSAENTYLASLIYQVMDTANPGLFTLQPVPHALHTESAEFAYTSPFIPQVAARQVFRPPLYA